MTKSKPKTIDEILTKFEPEQQTVAKRLRSLVKATLPDVEETVRRGVITYILNDKDFARIHLYKDHVDLGLLAGTKLDSHILKGKGLAKDVRHVKIVSIKYLDGAEITRLLKQAAALT